MTERDGRHGVLLVEDEPRLRATLRRSLDGRGYAVTEATTAGEAIAAAGAHRFAVVLLDVNLPDATGWDVLRAFRAAHIRTPVVVLSAAPPNPARVREFAPFGVLHKPFPIDALIRLVEAASGRPPPGDEPRRQTAARARTGTPRPSAP